MIHPHHPDEQDRRACEAEDDAAVWRRTYERERAKRIARLRGECAPIVAGGQGRSAASVEDGARSLLTLCAWALLLLCAWCAR